MLRGVLAFFWIALAGVSGVYLYSALADPAALGGQFGQPAAGRFRRDHLSFRWLRLARPGACRDQGQPARVDPANGSDQHEA